MTKSRITLLLLAFAFLVVSRPGLSAPLASTVPALCAANSSMAELPFFRPGAAREGNDRMILTLEALP